MRNANSGHVPARGVAGGARTAQARALARATWWPAAGLHARGQWPVRLIPGIEALTRFVPPGHGCREALPAGMRVRPAGLAGGAGGPPGRRAQETPPGRSKN